MAQMTAYHPATNTFKGKRQIDNEPLAKLVAGVAVAQLNQEKRELVMIKDSISSSMASIRRNRRKADEKTIQISKLEKNKDNKVETIIKEFAESDLMKSG